LECSGEKVVDDDVGFDEQPIDELAVVRPVQVGHDTELIAVDAQVIRAASVGIERRSPGPTLIPRSRPFQLDDIGAEVAERHGAERSRENAREVEYLEPFKHALSLL